MLFDDDDDDGDDDGDNSGEMDTLEECNEESFGGKAGEVDPEEEG